MTKVYIVRGTTGEYSDRVEWLVAAYADETLARRHAELAAEWYVKNDGPRLTSSFRWDRNKKNPFDPFMSVDYTGTDWTVEEVEMCAELPVLVEA